MICEKLEIFSTHITPCCPIIGIDYGLKKVGIAISTLDNKLALPHKLYYRKNVKLDFQYFQDLIQGREACGIVIGIPDLRNTWIKEISILAKKLSKNLNIAVYLEDETLSTQQAQEMLLPLSRSQIQKAEDATAASIILQRTLNKLNFLKNGSSL